MSTTKAVIPGSFSVHMVILTSLIGVPIALMNCTFVF